jgi:general secretion pathway protein J
VTAMPRYGEAGFTLLEILVALAVMGLLLAVSLASLRFGGRIWSNADERLRGMDEIRAVQELLRARIGAAYPAWLPEAGRPHIDFAGRPDRLVFLAAPPRQSGPGAFRRFDLRLDRDEHGEGKLDLAVSLDNAFPDRALSRPSVLLERVETVDFQYFGRAAGEDAPQWHGDWLDQSELPELVRMIVRLAPDNSEQWPELIIRPMVTVDAACSYDPVSRSCQGR